MKYLTAQEISNYCEDLSGSANRKAINKMFLEQDDSNRWPIKGKFNVTKRAIKHAQKFMLESGIELEGLEYALFIEDDTTRIVNDPKNL